jgi:hypothetical protein
MTYVVRPARFEDQAAVSELLGSIGWITRSRKGWEWLFKDNPCRRNQPEDAPIGWVIEDNQKLHGYLANIHLDYTMSGNDIKAVACSNYYISDEARSMGFKIMSEFFRQKNVEFYMSTTANSFSAPVYKMFKAASPEDPSFRKILFWFADTKELIRDVCQTKNYIPNVLGSLAPVLAPIVNFATILTGRRIPKAKNFKGQIRHLTVDEIGKEFDDLWQEYQKGDALKVRRDAEILRWYLSDPDCNSKISLFGAYEDDRLVGYAICGKHQPTHDVIAQYKVMDMVTLPNSKDVTAAILSKALEQAKREKAGLLVASRLNEKLASTFDQMGSLSIGLKENAHFARSTDKELIKKVVAQGGWEATGLDGDGLFSLLSVDAKSNVL